MPSYDAIFDAENVSSTHEPSPMGRFIYGDFRHTKNESQPKVGASSNHSLTTSNHSPFKCDQFVGFCHVPTLACLDTLEAQSQSYIHCNVLKAIICMWFIFPSIHHHFPSLKNNGRFFEVFINYRAKVGFILICIG